MVQTPKKIASFGFPISMLLKLFRRPLATMKLLPSLTRITTAAAASYLQMVSERGSSSVVATLKPNLLEMLPPFDSDRYLRRLFLLRHGETDWNLRGLMQGGGYDIELNQNGRLQAELVARELIKCQNVGVVASSHLKRAEQTADIVHSNLLQEHGRDVPRVILPEFGEMKFGDCEGTALRGPESTEESRQKFKSNDSLMRKDKDFAFPGGGESTRQVEERGLRGLENLYQRFPAAESIMIVAHGRWNKVLLSSLLYDDAMRYHEIRQGNSCINVIDQRKDGDYDEVVLSFVNHIDCKN